MSKLFLLALCVVAIGTTFAEEAKFTDKYDNVDLDEVLKNDRLFNSYYKCLMDQGKCTPEGADLKRIGVAVLAKAFNTFQILPPDLQPVVDNIYQTIKKEYETEAEHFSKAKIQQK